MEVLDEIIEWAASLPLWQRIAVVKVLNDNFKDEDVRTLADICIREQTEPEKLAEEIGDPLAVFKRTEDEDATSGVVIKEINSTKNINAIKDDSRLTFGESGLTIVYGSNAVGKSGFSRIFKAACMCRDHETVHGNISNEEIVEPSANILYSNSKPDKAYEWSAEADKNQDLQTVHIFDSRSARIHLSSKNEVLYVPAGLDIFDKLATIFQRVNDEFGGKVRLCNSASPDFPLIFNEYADTPAYDLLQNLDNNDKVAELKGMMGLNEAQTAELVELQRVIKEKEANHPTKRRDVLIQKKSRFTKLHNSLAEYQRKIKQEDVDAIVRAKSIMLEADKLAKIAKAKTFDESYLAGTGDPLWKIMWGAAKAYSEQSAYHSHDFPNTEADAKCVLCQQPVSREAGERLKGFKDFVTDKSQEVARKSRESYDKLLNDFKNIELQDRATLTEIIDEIKTDELPFAESVAKLLTSAETEFSRLTEQLSDETKSDPVIAEKIDFAPRVKLKDFIVQQGIDIAKFDVTKFTQELAKQKKRELVLNSQLQLEKYKEEIDKEIANLKRLAVLKKCISQTNTGGISRKSGELTTRFLGDTLKNTYEDQLRQLNRKGLIVELKKSHVDRGVAYSQIVVTTASGGSSNFKPDEIMSESEQKVASLAGFFTELSLAPHNSAIIFDDPVTSLDELNTARIAARIVKEAQIRQVIVFTHNLFFTAEMLNYSEKSGVSVTARTVSKALHAGQVIDDLPWQALSTKKRIGRLNARLQDLTAAFKQDKVAEYEPGVKQFYGMLRETWERGVEEVLFKDAVKRYSRSVETQKLKQIRLEDGDLQAVEENMTQCSFYAHTNPPDVDSVEIPEPQQLQEDLQRLIDWKTSIESRK